MSCVVFGCGYLFSHTLFLEIYYSHYRKFSLLLRVMFPLLRPLRLRLLISGTCLWGNCGERVRNRGWLTLVKNGASIPVFPFYCLLSCSPVAAVFLYFRQTWGRTLQTCLHSKCAANLQKSADNDNICPLFFVLCGGFP